MNTTDSIQLALCRSEYLRLARELAQKGLSREAIETCRESLVEPRDGRWFIRTLAYQPTGIALGYPLPQPGVQKVCQRAAQLIEQWLQVDDEPGFAYVPPPGYHITIVNRSHYEFNEVKPLTLEEFKDIQQTILDLDLGTITVLTSGLFLTHTGRIFVKCLVSDDKILRLRSHLAETYPQLRTNIPRLVHIKIGHLMKPLTQPQLAGFLLWLSNVGNLTLARLDFTDLYTPAGRIDL